MTQQASLVSKFSALCRKAFARPGSTAQESDENWPQEPTVYSGAWSATGLPGLLTTLEMDERRIGARDILFAHADLSETNFLDDREHWIVLARGPQLWLSHEVWGETAGKGDVLARAVSFHPVKITQAALLKETSGRPWSALLLSVLEQREMTAELRAQKARAAAAHHDSSALDGGGLPPLPDAHSAPIVNSAPRPSRRL